jgi:hypothetical protein
LRICLNVNMEPRKAQEAAVAERSGTGRIGALAKNLRLFGWVEFWLQAVFAVFTALLLHSALAHQGLPFIGAQTDS